MEDLRGISMPGASRRTRLRSLVRTARRWRRPALLGTARRLTPLSPVDGWDRGTPVDRFYIERFLARHRADVRGDVLEVQNATYTRQFGGAAVRQAAVLDLDASNPQATVIGDLSVPDSLPEAAFDCFILTQTLQHIPDPRIAVAATYRVLRPGGVALVTVPAAGRLSRFYPDFWRFGPLAGQRLFEEVFGRDRTTVEPCGSMLAVIAQYLGMAQEELSERELAWNDPAFPLVVAIRVQRALA